MQGPNTEQPCGTSLTQFEKAEIFDVYFLKSNHKHSKSDQK